jgi:hypothetical protein
VTVLQEHNDEIFISDYLWRLIAGCVRCSSATTLTDVALSTMSSHQGINIALCLRDPADPDLSSRFLVQLQSGRRTDMYDPAASASIIVDQPSLQRRKLQQIHRDDFLHKGLASRRMTSDCHRKRERIASGNRTLAPTAFDRGLAILTANPPASNKDFEPARIRLHD